MSESLVPSEGQGSFFIPVDDIVIRKKEPSSRHNITFYPLPLRPVKKKVTYTPHYEKKSVCPITGHTRLGHRRVCDDGHSPLCRDRSPYLYRNGRPFDFGLRFGRMCRSSGIGSHPEISTQKHLALPSCPYRCGKLLGSHLAQLCNDDDANLAEDFKAYKNNFSTNIQEILNELELDKHIDKMNKDGCLLAIIKAFSELDLSIEKFDSIKMGYIFENLIGRFYQNVDAGQYYTGRDIIKTLVSILVSEGCDDIFEENKVITVCDQACGTGGMLSTAYSYLKHYNPSCDVRLFGQEFMGQTYAIGLAEMLIKGQDAKNFRHADTFKVDCFKDQKMRFVIENPPFGTPWAGEDAKEGQEQAVKLEHEKKMEGRWGAGLPGGGDSQLIFMQSAIDKMDETNGRAAIIENGSPLFKGDTGSGESQIRRWMLESDLIEAIIALPTDLFYNTGIATYVWILSKNKRPERKGKVQLIDASNIYHKLRKAVGNKKNELSPEDRVKITKLYTDFEENELCKIFNNEDFLYSEYSVYQPLQKSYEITEERIGEMIQSGVLSSFYDENKVFELENSDKELNDKDKKTLKIESGIK